MEKLAPAVVLALPAEEDMGPKLLACRKQERLFVWAYVVNGGNGMQAAISAGYGNLSEAAKVRAHELLHRSRVLEAVHEVSAKALRGLSLLATVRAREVLERPDHPDLVKMIGMVWSRTGFHEKMGVDVHHSGSVDLNHTDSALEALAWMLQMQVPEAKLVEQFGHSGLARYRKMLEERDAKKGMMVIEHEPKS